MTTRSIAFTAVLALAAAAPAHAFELRLDDGPKLPSAQLDIVPGAQSDGIPNSMRLALASDVATALDLSAESFVRDVKADAAQATLAGGGAGDPDTNALLAFLLGLIPGFGLGHFLIAGDSAGGTQWLIIDIIFLVVLIVLDSFIFYGPLEIFGLLADLGWLIEHIFQGLSAYHAAGGRKVVWRDGETPAPEAKSPALAGARAVYPNLLDLHF
ncbi:MAG: hypothetical protein ACYCWW_07430 [Deltaproteobacteria bacterium]